MTATVGRGAVTVRAARPDEHAGVADTLEAAFTATFAITDWYRDNLRRIDEHAAGYDVWIARLDDPTVRAEDPAPIAGAVLTPHEDTLPDAPPAPDGVPEFSFRLLGVGPWARGHGVGRALVDHAIGLAREHGLSRIGIRSGPQMVEAHRMYERLGFVRHPDRETFVVDGGQRLRIYTYDLARPDAADHDRSGR